MNFKFFLLITLIFVRTSSIGQSYKDYKFQFNNTTQLPVKVSWEVYDVPNTGSPTLIELNRGLSENLLRIDNKKKYIRFTLACATMVT